MKKISILLAALAAAFVVSCNKENPIETPDTSAPAGMKQVTITASIEGAETKTSYDADGKFSWTKGDEVSVLASDNKFYTFVATTSGAKTELVGKIPDDASLGRFAYYPASDNHTYDSATWYSQFSLEEYKDLKGRFSAEIPMYGLKGENDKFTFKHLTGAAKLTFTNIPKDVTEVEISVKNEKCKFSGLWKVSTGSWGWSSASTEVDSELTFTRKVPVSDNTAILYLPYRGGIWYSSTINIIGFKGDDELHLLKDKKMKGNATEFEVAKVVPYTPLELPDYVPAADFSKVDWDVDHVLTEILPTSASSSRQALKELKLVADSDYLYARLKCSAAKFAETQSNYLGAFFYDVTNGSGDGYWSWWNSAAGNTEYEGEHIGSFEEGTSNLVMTFNGNSIDSLTETIEDDIYWYIAFPRNSHPLLSASGKVYTAFILYKDWGQTGALPDKYYNMLEVTLP